MNRKNDTFRAEWLGPARATIEDAKQDHARLTEILKVHAPDLVPDFSITELPWGEAMHTADKS